MASRSVPAHDRTPAFGKAVQRGDGLTYPGVGKRNRAFRRCHDFIRGLTLDGAQEPVIERHRGCAGKPRAQRNGDKVLRVKNARELLHTLDPKPDNLK